MVLYINYISIKLETNRARYKYSAGLDKWEKKKQVKMIARDFTGGAVVKNSPVNAGDMGSSPGPGGSDTPRSN